MKTNHEIFGITGKLTQIAKDNGLFKTQFWESTPRLYVDEFGRELKISLCIRYDDSCGNGYHTLGFTFDSKISKTGRWDSCGSCSDTIEKVFPEFASFLRFHLMGDGKNQTAMANAIYHASDKDYNGRRKGDVVSFETAIVFDGSSIKHKFKKGIVEKMLDKKIAGEEFKVVEIPYTGEYNLPSKFTCVGATTWHTCEFDTEVECSGFVSDLNSKNFQMVKIPTSISEGKERDFSAANRSMFGADIPNEIFLSDDVEKIKNTLQNEIAKLRVELKDMIVEKFGMGFSSTTSEGV